MKPDQNPAPAETTAAAARPGALALAYIRGGISPGAKWTDALRDLEALLARCEAAEAANRVLVEECDALKVSMQTMSPDEALVEQIALCENAQRRLGDAKADAERLEDALESMLNIEGAAVQGGRLGAYSGLDVQWHFDKARTALAAHRAGGGK